MHDPKVQQLHSQNSNVRPSYVIPNLLKHVRMHDSYTYLYPFIARTLHNDNSMDPYTTK